MVRGKRKLLTLASSVLCALAFASASAHAQSTDDSRARADTLFREGQDLMTAGQVQTACAKLEESQRLDPKIGRLLNVAYCHEQLGKVATAWSEYNQAAALALQTKQAERESFARKQANQLAHKLSFIRLDLSAAPEVSQVTLDGSVLAREQWSVPFPVDPGEHSLVFGGPGRKAHTQSVAVAGPGTMRVAVEALEADTGASAAAETPAAQPPAPPVSSLDTSQQQQPEQPPAPRPSRAPAWIVGGLGVAALGVGAGFGLRALSLKSDADGDCPNHECSAQGTSKIDDAKTAALISTIGFAAGAVGVGVSAWLFLRAPSPSSTARAQIVPYVASDRAGVTWQGTW
jgi:hypothetical protein